MGEGDDCDVIKVLDEGETLTEQAVVNQIADSSNSRCKLILFHDAFEQLS